MKLSEKLDIHLIERPDEWTMKEFYRDAKALEDALEDAVSGLRYIRQQHGNIYGVGFDRVEKKASIAFGKSKFLIEKEDQLIDTPELISGTYDALNKLSVRGE